MKLWLGVAIGFAASVGLGASAWADSPFYVSGSVGGYFRQSQTNSDQFSHAGTPTVTVAGTSKRAFDPGVMVNAALGYRLTRHVRVEAEFGYTTYAVSALNPLTTAAGFPELNGQAFKHSSGADFSRFSGEANIFYDFSPVGTMFTPYVGAGGGAVSAHVNDGTFTNGSSVFHTSGGSGSLGFAMVEAGVAIAVAPRLSIVPAYRFVDDFRSNEDVAHVFKVGLRYQF